MGDAARNPFDHRDIDGRAVAREINAASREKVAAPADAGWQPRLEVVVVGHSENVGKPIAFLLMSECATVTVCHHMTRSLAGAPMPPSSRSASRN